MDDHNKHYTNMIDRTNNTVEFYVEAPDGSPILAGKEYQWISPKDDYTGLSRVKTLDGKWGIIDSEGREVLKAEYDSVWKFEGKQRTDTKVIKDGEELSFSLIEQELIEDDEYVDDCYYNEPDLPDYEEERHFGRYAGSYAQDDAGYSDEEIDTIFDGDPSAYWNID